MTSGSKRYLLSAALVTIIAVPIAAQNHTAQGATAHASAASSSSWHGGGFVTGARVPNTPAGDRNSNRSGHPARRNRFGYGASILLPYDSEYDQLPGRGTFDQGDVQESQDNRPGLTIFEYNGKASTATAENRMPPQQEEPSEAEAGPSTVLIFRDGHQQEVANYAIAGRKLIVVGEKTEKIQLSDLDLNATAKANEDRGVDFKMPSQS
jgi:hypothetical protein